MGSSPKWWATEYESGDHRVRIGAAHSWAHAGAQQGAPANGVLRAIRDTTNGQRPSGSDAWRRRVDGAVGVHPTERGAARRLGTD